MAAKANQDPGCKLTYDTADLLLGNLMEWLRARYAVSQKAVMQHVAVRPVLDMMSGDNPVGKVNGAYDFLYRGPLDEANPRNEPPTLGAYAFVTFYKKTTKRAFKRGPTSHYPRARFELGHPQVSTHCLMRRDPPEIPLLSGRIPRMPADWKDEPGEEDAATPADYSDENHIAWALFVLALFYPISMSEEADLSWYGESLYMQVKNWWRTRYPTGKRCRVAARGCHASKRDA